MWRLAVLKLNLAFVFQIDMRLDSFALMTRRPAFPFPSHPFHRVHSVTWELQLGGKGFAHPEAEIAGRGHVM